MTLHGESTMTALENKQVTGIAGTRIAADAPRRRQDGRGAEAWGCLCRPSC